MAKNDPALHQHAPKSLWREALAEGSQRCIKVAESSLHALQQKTRSPPNSGGGPLWKSRAPVQSLNRVRTILLGFIWWDGIPLDELLDVLFFLRRPLRRHVVLCPDGGYSTRYISEKLGNSVRRKARGEPAS